MSITSSTMLKNIPVTTTVGEMTADKLPLAGGTMTGELKTAGAAKAVFDSTEHRVYLNDDNYMVISDEAWDYMLRGIDTSSLSGSVVRMKITDPDTGESLLSPTDGGFSYSLYLEGPGLYGFYFHFPDPTFSKLVTNEGPDYNYMILRDESGGTVTFCASIDVDVKNLPTYEVLFSLNLNQIGDVHLINEIPYLLSVAIAPAYDATKTYALDLLVTHEARLYRCTTAITTAEAWTAAHWTETTVATMWNNADTTSYGGRN